MANLRPLAVGFPKADSDAGELAHPDFVAGQAEGLDLVHVLGGDDERLEHERLHRVFAPGRRTT